MLSHSLSLFLLRFGLPLTFSNAMSFVKTFYSLAEFVLLLPFCYISFFLAHSRLHTNKHSIHSICDYEQTFFLLSLLLNRNIALMNLQMSIHLHLEIILFYHNRKCQHKMSNFIKVEVESKAFRWLCQTENIVFFWVCIENLKTFFFTNCCVTWNTNTKKNVIFSSFLSARPQPAYNQKE